MRAIRLNGSTQIPRLYTVAATAVVLLALASGAEGQQEKARPAVQHAGESQDQSSSRSFITPETAHNQNIPAAEEEDETAVYKNSPSVRKIGGMMGLSPRASSSAFEYFNFVLLAGLVLYYLAKALPKAFAARQKKIDQQLVEGARRYGRGSRAFAGSRSTPRPAGSAN